MCRSMNGEHKDIREFLECAKFIHATKAFEGWSSVVWSHSWITHSILAA